MGGEEGGERRPTERAWAGDGQPSSAPAAAVEPPATGRAGHGQQGGPVSPAAPHVVTFSSCGLGAPPMRARARTALSRPSSSGAWMARRTGGALPAGRPRGCCTCWSWPACWLLAGDAAASAGEPPASVVGAALAVGDGDAAGRREPAELAGFCTAGACVNPWQMGGGLRGALGAAPAEAGTSSLIAASPVSCSGSRRRPSVRLSG